MNALNTQTNDVTVTAEATTVDSTMIALDALALLLRRHDPQ